MVTPEELMPGIWLVRGESGLPNQGLLLRQGSAVLVDPRAGAEGSIALQSLAKKSAATVAAVVLTHSEEHAHSSEWSDAQIISPRAAAGFGGLSVALPLAAWEVTTLEEGTRIGVCSRTARVLFCGDTLAGEDVPVLRSGSESYLEAIERVETLDIRLLIPAYGQPALGKREIRARIERERNYVYSVVRHVGTTMVAGVSLERAVSAARAAYEDYPYLEQHVANISSVWQEMQDIQGA